MFRILESDSSSGLIRKTSCDLRLLRRAGTPVPIRVCGARLWGRSMREGPDEADELKARLAKLRGDLQSQRDGQKEVQRKADGDLTDKGLGQAMSLGFRVLSEFVAATVVGAVIGWQLDLWIGTAPFLLILFLGLGVAAGFWSVYRLAVTPPAPRDGQKPPQ